MVLNYEFALCHVQFTEINSKYHISSYDGSKLREILRFNSTNGPFREPTQFIERDLRLGNTDGSNRFHCVTVDL